MPPLFGVRIVKVAQDYRFGPSFANIALYLVMWLVLVVVLTVVVAVLLRGLLRPGLSAVLRFLYYIPGALAGVASVQVWLFLLNPTVSPVSPVSPLLRAFGLDTFAQAIAPGNLPVIFVLIAFWTGAGGWIVVMYGALNNIPDEVVEAARVDGAGLWQTAWHIQIPMIRKWIVYYVYAFQNGDFNGAAAISLVLLVLGLLCAGLLVTRSGLFKADDK